MIPQSKSGHQIKALFLKNLHIQKRQPCTNCCQIMTPIICLLLTIVIRNAAIDNIPTQNDTLYAEFPLIALKFNDYSMIDELPEYIRRNPAQWYLFDYQNPADAGFIGEHDGWYHNSGMLGLIKPTYQAWAFHNNSLENQWGQWRRPPEFKHSNRTINEELYLRYQFLNNDTLYSLKHTTAPQHLPDGSIHYFSANKDGLKAELRVKDVRQFLFYHPNGITEIGMKIDLNNTHFNYYYTIAEGFLSIMDMVTQAYIKAVTGQTVVSGYTYMPITEDSSIFIQMLINTVASIIFPLSLSLLLPVFLYLTVLEKEQKLIQMMRMNGMSMLSYWSINFMYNLSISILTNLVFCIFGYVFLGNSFFIQTSPLLIFIVLLGWALSQIGLAMLLQVFLSASRAANIIGYLVSIWTNLIGATLSIALFQFPNPLPLGFRLWPTFAFDRVFYLMFTYCSMDQCINTLDSVTDQMWQCITILYVSFILFALIGMYLFEVIPQEYGVSQPVLFPVYFILDQFRRRQNQIENEEVMQGDTKDDATMDEQRAKINALNDLNQYPLVCNGLSKRYKTGKLAVNKLSLVIQDKTIFGLLGPNGAGKTTLLSMITGIFEPSSGKAYVGGYSIIDQIDKVHLQMGVCPQFDIVWPTLTVQEHLYFYARLRGVDRKDEAQKVQQTLQEVNLVEQRHFGVTQLSGGMKRRLSIGISLVGDPRIVFMDEPTTGLDPENRRHLWQVLSKCRDKRSIFLTTHMMEQAEALCDKIGIITAGTIRTVGDQFRLKEIYGKGYFVSVCVDMDRSQGQPNGSFRINQDYEDEPDEKFEYHHSIMTEKGVDIDSQKLNREKVERLKEKMLAIFHPATVCREIAGLIKINVSQTKVSQILQNLRQLKEQNINFEWAISDSSLEDVFLQVISRFDKSEKASLMQSLDEPTDQM